MAALDELINQIDDEVLRERIRAEVKRVNKQKKFGLVFEQHLPEATPLYDVPIKKGSVVAIKGKSITDVYLVETISDGGAVCIQKSTKDRVMLPVKDLVAIAQFGEPIFPYLQPIDSVCNAPESDLWHTLIEADNFHALQLLEYLYAGKVDCIYIDPPYNTGARDWKYNNDYVDGSDSYRHSKWLSFMEKRLKLAKKLLNPKDSVLIVTIDEKEYHHLACLLEDVFPGERMQMISSVINPKGNRRDNEFSRCEEYIYVVYLGEAKIESNGTDMLRFSDEDSAKEGQDKSIRLRALLRGASNHGKRTDRPNLFYPLLFEKNTGKFMGHGPVLAIGVDRSSYVPPENMIAMWPIAVNGTELTWNLQPETLMEKHRQHFLSFGEWDGTKRVGYYLSSGQEENFKRGMYKIVGQDADGAYIIELNEAETKDVRPLTIWHKKSHSASEYGTTLLNGIFLDRRFSFPKSLYAVKDTLYFFVRSKKSALIVDFFAGSGTTLHAVNLLNAIDGGQRRCILVTNNEVSVEEAKSLREKGYQPGDEEWEKIGIARYVTWPRTVCSIKGCDVKKQPLKGYYLETNPDCPIAMEDGFAANAVFFKLGFLDKTAVSLGRKFKEMLPLLWMKAGARGPCPSLAGEEIPPMMILPENQMAVLSEEWMFEEFAEKVNADRSIKTVFLVTDSDTSYKEMAAGLRKKETHQLYREYLDNFRINQGGNRA